MNFNYKFLKSLIVIIVFLFSSNIQAQCTFSGSANSSTNPLSGMTGCTDITITGTITLDGDWDLSLGGYSFENLIIDGGSLVWDGKHNLNLPGTATLRLINSPTLVHPSPATSQYSISIGGTEVATANGGGGTNTSFADILLAGGVDLNGPLPIELNWFSIEQNEASSILSWQTVTEVDNYYFSIEHSINGRDFRAIGKVEGAGNSIDVNDYSFVHENPSKGINYYRLVQYDFDGSEFSSHIESVFIGGLEDWFLTPTRTQDVLSVNWNEASTATQEIVIYNLAGQSLYSQKVGPNSYKLDINTSNLIDGLYLVQIKSGKNISTRKFQKI